MQANEALAAMNPEVQKKPPQIASSKHLVGFLLIGAGVVILGLLAQHAPTGRGVGAPTGQLGRHSQAIHIYLSALLMDWALLYYCWVGVHHRGGSLRTLSGGRLSCPGREADGSHIEGEQGFVAGGRSPSSVCRQGDDGKRFRDLPVLRRLPRGKEIPNRPPGHRTDSSPPQPGAQLASGVEEIAGTPRGPNEAQSGS
jgi:hypothetical protein